MTAPPLLEVDELVVDYPLPRRGLRRRPHLRAVDHVSFTVEAGETLGLVGESGSGKTTVGRSILGLTRVSAGTIRFDGMVLTGDASRRSRATGAEVQAVFQNPYSSLNPTMTVGHALGEPLRVHRGLRGAALEESVAGLLARVGLDPSTAARRPDAFSGGQRQRIAIARAISLDPRFIVYDEAVSALDASSRGHVVNLIESLRRDQDMAALFIGHDLSIVEHVSDRIAVLFRGHVVEMGPAPRVASEPQHPYTRQLVESIPVADPSHRRARRPTRAHDPADSPTGCPFASRCPERVAICDEAAPVLRPVGPSLVACHLAGAPSDTDTSLACVEIGGNGTQTIVFSGDQVSYRAGVDVQGTARIGLAVPGLVDAGRVVVASNLGWRDVDPGTELGLDREPTLVCNDAGAAALGEWVLRGRRPERLVYVGLGTGVGGAVVDGGRVLASNLLGHQAGFSESVCTCGRRGCLETVAGGWALPQRLTDAHLDDIGRALAAALDREPLTDGVELVVLAGGITSSYPSLLRCVAHHAAGRTVEATRAPGEAKSAAAWGLRHLLHHIGHEEPSER